MKQFRSHPRISRPKAIAELIRSLTIEIFASHSIATVEMSVRMINRAELNWKNDTLLF